MKKVGQDHSEDFREWICGLDPCVGNFNVRSCAPAGSSWHGIGGRCSSTQQHCFVINAILLKTCLDFQNFLSDKLDGFHDELIHLQPVLYLITIILSGS